MHLHLVVKYWSDDYKRIACFVCVCVCDRVMITPTVGPTPTNHMRTHTHTHTTTCDPFVITTPIYYNIIVSPQVEGPDAPSHRHACDPFVIITIASPNVCDPFVIIAQHHIHPPNAHPSQVCEPIHVGKQGLDMLSSFIGLPNPVRVSLGNVVGVIVLDLGCEQWERRSKILPKSSWSPNDDGATIFKENY